MRALFNMPWVLLLTLMFCECGTQDSNLSSDVANILGRELVLPHDLDTMETGTYTIVRYIDSVDCLGCQIHVQEWQKVFAYFDSLCPGCFGSILLIKPRNLAEAKIVVKRGFYNWPVYYDCENEFYRLNPLPSDNRFRCFLVDSTKKVVLIGDPVKNSRIFELYVRILTDAKPVYPQGGRTCSGFRVNLGSFDWKQSQSTNINIFNATDSLWRIDSIRTSCECTYATVNSMVIVSHDSATAMITFKADAPGEFMREVYLDINGEEAKLTLAIEGKAE